MRKILLPLVIIAMVLSIFGVTTEAVLAPTLRKEEGCELVLSDTMEGSPVAAALSGGGANGTALMKHSASGLNGLALASMDPMSALLTTDTMKMDLGGTKDEMRLLADADISKIGDMSRDNSTLRIKFEMDPRAQIACMNYDAEATGPGPSPTTMEVFQEFNP